MGYERREAPSGDPLASYRTRRDFRRTPEPTGAGAPKGRPGLFVVQRHAARQLHFDFRLEMDGVLKSWAVPKGVPEDPRERRLAIQVEDHPLDYAGFEGIIPAGQYGAGRVELWDRGSWSPEGDGRLGYKRGKLVFRLFGRRLSGRWVLVRFKPAAKSGAKASWLLRKLRSPDERAGGGVQGGSPQVRPRRRPRAAGPSPSSDRVQPELATLVEEPPRGDGWLHEIKLDGYRLVSTLSSGAVRMRTRNDLEWSGRLPDLARELSTLPARSAVLDGELVALTPEGKSDFGLLKEALSKGRRNQLFYYVFDLLQLDGEDLRARPLVDRKAALARLLGAGARSPHLRYSEHVLGSGELFYRHACDLSLEGIVSKRMDSPYRSGRSDDWLKVKCHARQEFVIGGFTEPRGSRKGLGALLLGAYEGKRLVYAGRVGTGLTRENLGRLRRRLAELERTTSPFDEAPAGRELRGIHWTEPSLVAEVSFANWTAAHRLRQASFVGLREDKRARDVGKESPKPRASSRARLTHPDRRLFPDLGLTKADLARYYETVAPWLLPHVRGRLLAIVRCPDGVGKACFFQRHWTSSMPEAIQSVPFREQKKAATGIRVDDLEGLRALVQIGAIELHPWGSRLEDLEHPDRAVFDLDPGPDVPWRDVVTAARLLETVLADQGLESFPKTTGGKGLHVVVPLRPPPDWPTLRRFCQAVADDLVRRSPDRHTTALAKRARAGKILIDVLRDVRGAMSVAPYSVRANPRATVSTPLSWKELSASLHPEEFTVRSVPPRLLRLSVDPWGRLPGTRQALPAVW